MTVAELIAELEAFDPDTPVRVAMQPSWPLCARIESITELAAGAPDEDDPDDDLGAGEGRSVCWLAIDQCEHDGSPYAPRAAWSGR